jgi:hypothetical protein
MNRNRHIKTLPEKYGLVNIMLEVKEYLEKQKHRHDDNITFEELPYVGVAYVDWDDRSTSNQLLYHFEHFSIKNTSLVKVKVLSISDNEIIIAHYDDHHKQICIMDSKHDEMVIEGNVIRHKDFLKLK